MRFSDAYLLEFAKINTPAFMVAAYPSDESLEAIRKYQDSLDLKRSKKVLTPDEYHVTLRYFKKEKFDKPDEVIKWLKEKDFKFKPIECTFSNMELLGDDKALVIRLKSKELDKLQKEIDKGLQDLGAPASDFPNFKAHLSLAYGYPDICNDNPKFNKIILDKIRFVTNEDRILYEKVCD